MEAGSCAVVGVGSGAGVGGVAMRKLVKEADCAAQGRGGYCPYFR